MHCTTFLAPRGARAPMWPQRVRQLATLLLGCTVLVGCGGGDTADAHLRAASEAIVNDAYDAASLQLINALQADPTNADTRALLAQVALIAGRASVTERQARAVARLDDTPERGRELLCKALLARGEFDTLLREFLEDASPLSRGCRGQALLKLNQVDDAILQFNNLLLDNPESVVGQLGLAEAEAAQGRLAQAERRTRNLMARYPLRIDAQRRLAAILVAQNRLDEAVLVLRDAIALPRDLVNHPDWLEARVVLAEVLWRQGKEREAIDELTAILDGYPSHPLPKYLRALLAYEDRDYRLSREYLRSVLNLVPGHEESEKLSAAADLAQGQFGSAQLPFVEGEKDFADDALMIELQSRIFLGMGNAGEAASVMQNANGVQWNDSALRHLARALTLSGQFDAAQEVYADLLQRNPNDLVLSIRTVANRLHQGQLVEADRAMADWPVNDRTQNARSALRLLRFIRAGDLRRAEDLAKRRRRDDASDLTALLALAESAERQGRRDDAVRWLELAIERNPEAGEPRVLLAHYASLRGGHEKMREMADGILAQTAYNADALALRGEASLLRGDAFAAIDSLREAARVAPSSTRVAVSLIRAQLASGDFWQARRDIKGALLRGALTAHSVAGLAIEEHRRGNVEQALALSDDLVGLDRSRATGLVLKGDLLLLDGEFNNAASAYERAFRVEPSKSLWIKAVLAAQGAGRKPGEIIAQWVTRQPDDAQLQSIWRGVTG